jgi:hypothetical protein
MLSSWLKFRILTLDIAWMQHDLCRANPSFAFFASNDMKDSQCDVAYLRPAHNSTKQR